MEQNQNKRKKIGRKQKKRLAIVTVILMIISIIGVVLLTPGFNIKEIKVTGNSVLKTEDIIAKSGIKKGVNIFDFDKGEAKKNILSMGYVAEAKIKRNFPSTVEISIVEEVGVAYIKAENGYVIITADGRCIDDVKKDDNYNEGTLEIPEMPLVTGLEDVKYKVGEIITSENSIQLESLFKCLHEFSKSGHVFNMLEIDMSNINKIKFFYMSRDLEVILGDSEKIDHKMNVFEKALPMASGKRGRIHLENVANPGANPSFEEFKNQPELPEDSNPSE